MAGRRSFIGTLHGSNQEVGALMRISIRKKIFLAFAIFLGLSALIWIRSYYSQYVLNQKIEIIEKKNELLNIVLEARRYEKNFFLSFDQKNIEEALAYARQAEELLRNILKRFKKYTLAKNLDQTLSELIAYQVSLNSLLALHAKQDAVPAGTVDSIRKRGRYLTSELEHIVKDESQFIQNLISQSKATHLVALFPIFILSVLVAIFLVFNVDRPLKSIENAITKIASGDFHNIPEIKTGDEFESLVASLNNMIGELSKRNKQLVQAQKLASLGKLTSGVAHELNNPLNNISTSIQILIEEIEEDDLAFKKSLLEGAEKEVDRGKDIVRSLLEFARERTLTLKPVNFKELVENALGQVRSQIPENIRLLIEVPDKITAELAPERIERVLMNLVMNAIHAMQAGGDITIRAENEVDQAGFSFQVVDSGVGIPPEIVPKIFDPFFTTKEVGKGSGLGLSIIYGIIKQHDGRITVSSEVGKGTTFNCFLPYNQTGQSNI
jgi:two-component system NtrC family sensor kinase